MPPQNFQSNGCLPGQPQNPIQIQKTSSPYWHGDFRCSQRLPCVHLQMTDFLASTWRLPCEPTWPLCMLDYLPNPTSVRAAATCPSPTSHCVPWLPATARLPTTCPPGPYFRYRITTVACARPGGFDRKGCAQEWRVTLMAATTARGLPKTTSADDKTRSAGYQPSAPCAEHRRRKLVCVENHAPNVGGQVCGGGGLQTSGE